MTVRLVGIVNTFFKAWYFLFFNSEVIDWDKKNDSKQLQALQCNLSQKMKRMWSSVLSGKKERIFLVKLSCHGISVVESVQRGKNKIQISCGLFLSIFSPIVICQQHIAIFQFRFLWALIIYYHITITNAAENSKRTCNIE